MNDPKMILADEPTGNLDTKTGQDVFNLLTLLSRKFRRTVIMVTHNPEVAAAQIEQYISEYGIIC
jgi:putative ABC transport system ATP-binding protein